ncbi:MAG: MarR family transcriptional regulator, partial [Deltaproteobacteria bacterium]
MICRSSDTPNRLATALHKLALAERHDAWREAHGRGLSPTQAQILSMVATRPRTVSELAADLGLTAGTVSASASALEQKGLVRKRPVPDGGRARHVVPTPAGRAAV